MTEFLLFLGFLTFGVLCLNVLCVVILGITDGFHYLRKHIDGTTTDHMWKCQRKGRKYKKH